MRNPAVGTPGARSAYLGHAKHHAGRPAPDQRPPAPRAAGPRRQLRHHRRGGRQPQGHLRRGGHPGREAGRRPDPARASSRATGSGPSAGTTRATSRRTSPSPAMGAVLHTLNIRLPAEQLAYVINHAEDRCIIVDASLIPLLAGIKDELKTVETIIVVGEGDTSALGETLSYERLLAAEQPGFDWPDLDERSAAAMCYTSGTTGSPKGVVYSHRSIWLHTMAEQAASSVGMTEDDRILIIVPMFHAMAWGTPYGAWLAGTDMIMPQMYLMGQNAGRRHQRAPAHAGLRRADHLERPAGPRHADRLLAGARHHGRRRRRAAVAHRGVRGALRRHHHPGLGHDRDQPAGRLRAAPGAPAQRARRHVLQDQGRPRRRRGRGARRGRGRHACCPTTARRWGSSRSAARGSPARTTRTRTRRSSTTAGCAPATSARSTPRAT